MELKEVIKIFKVFSDPTRLRIFLLLLDAELCVCELMSVLKVEQSLISHQLKTMREAGLVEATHRSRWVFYRIPEPKRKELGPLFENWLKVELSRARRQNKEVKDRKVCPLEFKEAKRMASQPFLKLGAGRKARKKKKQEQRNLIL